MLSNRNVEPLQSFDEFDVFVTVSYLTVKSLGTVRQNFGRWFLPSSHFFATPAWYHVINHNTQPSIHSHISIDIIDWSGTCRAKYQKNMKIISLLVALLALAAASTTVTVLIKAHNDGTNFLDRFTYEDRIVDCRRRALLRFGPDYLSVASKGVWNSRAVCLDPHQ
jgi:hypothetical protein